MSYKLYNIIYLHVDSTVIICMLTIVGSYILLNINRSCINCLILTCDYQSMFMSIISAIFATASYFTSHFVSALVLKHFCSDFDVFQFDISFVYKSYKLLKKNI